MTRFVLTLALLTSTGLAVPAQAQDLTCKPAKKMMKSLARFDSVKAQHKDTLEAKLDAKLVVNDGGAAPNMTLRDGDKVIPLTVAADGQIVGINKVVTLSQNAELCMDRPEGAADMQGKITVTFKNNSGSHSIAELKDGTAADGKAMYKKMVAPAVAMFVPKMTHASVLYKDAATNPDIKAYKGGELVGDVPTDPFGDAYLIDVAAVESMGADEVRIAGGDYRIEPSPSLKKLNQLGISPDGDGHNSL